MAAKRRTQGAPPVAESAAALLQAHDASLDAQPVEVPEWGVTVMVRGLTRGEMKHIGKDEVSEADASVYALACGLVTPKISEDDARQLLDQKGFAATERILNAILDKSGMGAGFRQG